MILNDSVDIILLQVPLAKSICLSGTRFVIWKQEGLRARGHLLRMTLYMGIAKHSSSKKFIQQFHYKALHGKVSIYYVDKMHRTLTLWAGPFL